MSADQVYSIIHKWLSRAAMTAFAIIIVITGIESLGFETPLYHMPLTQDTGIALAAIAYFFHKA